MGFGGVATSRKRLALGAGLLLAPGQLLAQKTAPQPAATKQAGFVFPVSPQTHRIIYQDTITVAGATAETLTNRFFNAYARSFRYADYNLLSPADTTHQLRPRQPAAPGEKVTIGTVMLGSPATLPVFVAGVTPPEALKYAPPIRYLHFTLRFRAEPGRAYVTITDLHQRSTTLRQEMARQYGLDLLAPDRRPAAPARQQVVVSHLPASTPVEALYWHWLPASARAALKPRQPATEPVPTSADARQVGSAVQRVLGGLKYQLAQY